MTPSRNLDKVWLVFCTDKAMSDEEIDNDETTVWLEGGGVVVEDRDHLLDGHELGHAMSM
jgi:hypothetical protein